MPLCLIEEGKVVSKNICFGKINIGENFSYEGEFKYGQLDGKGTFIWHKSDVYKNYVGEFKDDKLHGTGTVSYTHLTLPTNREV